MIIPFSGFVASVGSLVVNMICLGVGIVAALGLDRFNQKFEV